MELCIKNGQIHTLTTLSQPHDTMTGFMTLGEKRTHDTLYPHSKRDERKRWWYTPLCMTIFFDVILAFAESIPELDRAVTRARDDLAVVGAEADGEDVGCVANEATGCCAGVEVPEAESVVPG